MFKSLQSRIIALFVLAIVTSTTALVFVLVRFNDIGQGLDALNARFLPIADEATRLEIIVNQLQREQDSVSRTNQGKVDRVFLNAPFYTEELREGLERTQTLLKLPFSNTEQLDLVVIPMLDELSLLLSNYVSQLERWRKQPSVEERKNLDRHKTKLVLGVNRFSATINAQIISVSQKTALAREQSSQLGTVLAMCSFGFWVMLVVVMLRTLRPIQELTTQVQKVRSGERVSPLSESIAEEISVLIREFNGMADAVTERDLRLNERANALDLLSIRLQQALDSIASAVFVVEKNQIEMLNPAAKELWGLAIGDAPPSWLATRSLGHHPETPIDNRIVRIDIAEFGQDGTIIVTEDITEQVEDRERLYQAQRLALIGRMLAQVTHEIRNPLNAISLNVEMLTDESLSKDGIEMLQLIQSEIHRLEDSTQRYLDLSRQREPVIDSYSPLAIIREVVHFESISSEIQVDISGTDVEVLVDEDILRRALRNLLRNAVEAKATSITLSVRPLRSRIEVLISDDGCGINEHVAKTAFDPFFTTKSSGTGLGLAICRQELSLIGAELELNIEKQQTTFIISLPTKRSSI